MVMTVNHPSAETYAAAVHQIFELRRALAYEGDVLNAHLMPSFPRKPGVAGRQLVIDAARAATGEVRWAFTRASDSEMQGPAAKYDTDYAAALREVDDLRMALGSFSSTVEGFLAYKTFPASRRRYAVEQVARLRQAAAGELDLAYGWTHTTDLNRALRNAHIDLNVALRSSDQMTVGQWEDERRSWVGDR